jgi:hypothetical protein
MKFSIWYNEESNFLPFVKKYKNNISTVYFPMFHWVIWSWRTIIERTKNIKDYYRKVIPLLILCKSYWIETDLVLNSTCDWINTCDKQYRKKIINYIKPLTIQWLSTITLTNYWYIEMIKKEFPDIKICNSLNLEWVKTLEQAIHLKNLWIDILTIDSSINYNLPLIKQIKEKTWLKIKIFLNNSCMSSCPFHIHHTNSTSHVVEPEGLIWEKWACWRFYNQNRRKFFRISFIRPEDLHNYDFVDYYKISTRDKKIKFIENLLNMYLKKSYDWNILDILEFNFPDLTDNKVKYIDNKKLWKLWFFEDMVRCVRDCDTCTNCDKFF